MTADGEQRARRLLAVGFLLVILLLLADALIGFHSIRSIQTTASELAEDQFTQMALVDEVQREQGSLSTIFYRLAGGGGSLDRSQILEQINATERNIRQLVDRAPHISPDREAWNHLGAAASAFAAEARRLLALDYAAALPSQELLQRHEEVVNTVGKLIRLTHNRSRAAKTRIELLAAAQLRRDTVLLGGSVLLAFLCAWLVMRTSTRLYQKIRDQSEQLTWVSWQLLDNQERVARRLSHELHDELGQTLTALKTSVTRHANAPCADPEWLHDCSDLLKESIRSVHEISQLLRPTILDDFGLDSALNWLCERFADRGGLEITYSSEFHGRLPGETETHLFRIAQEALTNAVRHSGASRVSVRLRQDETNAYLAIEDNGKGLPPPEQLRKGTFGLIGMRARARSSGGDLEIRSHPGRGTAIVVSVPLGAHVDETQNPHLVG
ncbi:MAG: sensor histidine kinase [Bryobacteraceae bacterium]|nr:sensor histidine kinase [Bryobacteraceae bacterium]